MPEEADDVAVEPARDAGASEEGDAAPPSDGPVVASGPMSIGEVLSVLQEEFPDVTISKIRFLESQGLVRPERNASGYRQFRDGDIERLRWILRQQRDNFLPLKVIKKTLEGGVDVPDAGRGDQPTLWAAAADAAADAIAAADDRGRAAREAEETGRDRRRRHPSRGPGSGAGDGLQNAADRPGAPAGPGRRHATPADVVAALQEDPRHPAAGAHAEPAAPPSDPPAELAEHTGDAAPDEQAAPAGAAGRAEDPLGSGERHGDERLDRHQLLVATGLDDEQLTGLEEYGLVVAGDDEAGEPVYDAVAVRVATAARRLEELGVEPRHLRIYKVAAEREAGLVQQLVMPLLKQRNPAARARAVEAAAELSHLGADVHAALLGRELGPLSP